MRRNVLLHEERCIDLASSGNSVNAVRVRLTVVASCCAETEFPCLVHLAAGNLHTHVFYTTRHY